jgi:hypothetical protein
MSSAFAIGTVTAVLKSLLDNSLSQLSMITVQQTSVHPPDQLATGEKEASQLNLFMYHVTPNSGWRNAGLPSRSANGDRLSNPPLALDLHYLLTAYSREKYHAEVLLGYGMQVFHEVPVLTRQAIRNAFTPPGSSSRPPGTPPPDKLTALEKKLYSAELDVQIEQIKICPETLSTEEMSRLWSTFQAHYRPTAAYQVSVVLIESKRSTQTALPVQQRNVSVFPFRQPVIERVISSAGADRPIVMGSTLIITGQQLQAASTHVQISSVDLQVPSSALSDTRITLPLAPPTFPLPVLNNLRAGVQSVRVVHDLILNTPGDPHRGVESNVEAFVLRPKIQGESPITVSELQTDARGQFRTVTVKLNPLVGTAQRVVLLLNERNGSRGFTFVANPLSTDTDTVSFRIANVAAGIYLVRVQVDGAESLLDVDTNPESPTFNQFTGTPNVTIP